MASDSRRATLYLRNVPAVLVRDAKVKAAREGISLTAVVTEALAKSLKPGDETQPSPETDLRESMDWYRVNRGRLLKRHRGEYVAILERKVVDHGANFESLAARVFARWGVKPVFMPRVTEGTERTRIRSPRRKRT